MEWLHTGSTGTPQTFNLISREQLRRLSVDEGKSDAEIASLFGVTANEVNRKRRQMNLVAGQMSSSDLAMAVRLGEKIKTLPLEAIHEIESIVAKYTNM